MNAFRTYMASRTATRTQGKSKRQKTQTSGTPGVAKGGAEQKRQTAVPQRLNLDPQLEIKPIEDNSKDKIEQPRLSKEDVIPRINTSNIFVGSTGMGKSTLITNLVSKTQFFGGKRSDGRGWFDHIILISPTGDTDDVQKAMGVDDAQIVTDLKEAPGVLRLLMREQKKKIKEMGADKAPNILLIYDDIVSHPLFMKDPQFIKSFIANRHHNFTVLLGSQSWTKAPRAVRLQARGIFYFAGGISEVELLCDEYCPPGLNRYDFKQMIDYATRDPYSFLYINKSVPMKQRFRKNLGEIIQLEYFRESKTNPDFALPEVEEDDKSNDNNTQNQAEKEEFAKTNPFKNARSQDEQELRDRVEDLLKRKPPEDHTDIAIFTDGQYGSDPTISRSRRQRRRFLEQSAEKNPKHVKQKPQKQNVARSRRLESGYYP